MDTVLVERTHPDWEAWNPPAAVRVAAGTLEAAAEAWAAAG